MAIFYKVGGCVRDKILGIESKDIDYAVEVPSFEAMREAILARGGRIFVESPEHFTIRAHIPELGACDYVVTRKEGPYSDGRHPDWVKVGTIVDDLARRDFRMNAIAEREDGIIFDPHYGREDIEDRLIQCVGNPFDRFTEDRLRPFRAVRFAVQKNFHIVADVQRAIKSMIPTDFDSVSTERIRDEIMKMMVANTAQSCWYLFNEYNQLGKVMEQRGIWFLPTTGKRVAYKSASPK